MSHFAEIKDGIVQRVIVAEQDYIDSGSLGDPSNWVQTSYNHNFRKRFAGMGNIYDSEKDIFIQAQPFPSWTLDENSDWQPPVPFPNEIVDGRPKLFDWNEEAQSWDEVE